ncbi:MAG: response regulator transcription factor [Clostridiaceae bacterium]
MRILVVEDEVDILQALKQGLKKEGYAVDIADHGEVALELVAINSYDLILLDINLPYVNGYDVLKSVREKNSDVAVIIASANREIEDRIKGLDLGANDYIVKPFDLRELKARIRALLRREFKSAPNIIIDGHFKIDLGTLKVSYEDKEIILTLKEYSIFAYLVKNKGKVISANKLFEHIWNDEADPFSEVLRVHVYSLRKKLNLATGKDNIIKTLKGVGYMFEGQ